MDDEETGISSTAAGLLMFGCALVGLGFLVGLWFMNKSEDPLYRTADPNSYYYNPRAELGNPREMQTSTGLWKDKHTDSTPVEQSPARLPQQPKPITLPPAQQPPPQAPSGPPTTGPG